MTYQEALTYLYKNLPMYQRQGPAAYKKDLTNIRALCDALDHPETRFPAIHIAGTNGKGSVSHMMASILQSAGYQTGLHTSPHYLDFRERIKIDGHLIPKQWVVDFLINHQSLIDRVQPSFFEITTAMAFQYFAEHEVDIAIVEVGLGGRLDSTNILTPLLSVITNIGYDHQQFLGTTLPEIAREKAGIIKQGVPVIIGEEQDETTDVFEKIAHEREAELFFTSRHCDYEIIDQGASYLTFSVYQDDKKVFKNLKTDCPVSFQLRNILTTLQTLNYLPSPFSIPKDAVYQGLQEVRQKTGFMGRWQILSHQPLTVADGAHNAEGIREVVKQLQLHQYYSLRIVYGCVVDKQVDELLPMFPGHATFYLCEPAIDRKMPIDQLSETADNNGFHYTSYANVKEAYRAAKYEAEENDLIFVGGSIFVVAEVI